MADDYTHTSRSRQLSLAAAGLLLAVLLIGGMLLVGRAVTGATSATVPLPDPDSTPARDEDGVALVDGVPWGFALDRPGAVAAAAAVITVTGQAEVAFDPDRFDELAGLMFTPSEAAVQARQVEVARTNFELSGWAEAPDSRRIYHLAPLAVRLTAFDDDAVTASVEVWAVTLVGVGDTGGAVFTTSTLELAADEDTGTWRVWALDTVEGPVPLVYDAPSAPGRTRQVVRDAIPMLPLPYATATAEDLP